VPAREHRHHPGCARRRTGASQVLPFEPCQLAVQSEGAETPLMQAREAESLLGYAQARTLDPPADTAADAAQILAPVVVRPDLVPVDQQPEPGSLPGHARSEQREVRKRRGVHDVIAPPATHQVCEDAQAE